MRVTPARQPLVSHASANAIIAYRDGVALTVRRFLADVERVAAVLAEGEHVLNLCCDRYHFMVGLAAAVTAGKTSLLPPTHTPEMFRRMANFAPDVFCLIDTDRSDVGLPCVSYPETLDRVGFKETLDRVVYKASPGRIAYLDVRRKDEAGIGVPLIDSSQTVAYVFTSGSTGLPVPHKKTWGALVRNARAEAELLNIFHRRGGAIVGTVPPQHMYGFESTVLLAMQGGGAMSANQPFYPLDICRAIEALPRPRVLVSTPFHLRHLLAAGLKVPPVDLLISATAPISRNLVRDAEKRFGAPLMEIYGCTETGQLASRRPAETDVWRLYPEVRLTSEAGRIWASGGHVEGRVALEDIVELVDPEHFLLHGRSADLVNIAGKRCSLTYLNHQLNAIPGVQDGIFFMPKEESAEQVTRLTAVVVAPELDAPSLLRALRERINPAFLPRPLLFVDRLPRNSTGKLPREALHRLVDAQAQRCRQGRPE